jgi:hypothetical protein
LTIRNYGGGGGKRYGGGGGGSTISLSFPPFTYAVKWLVIANTVVFFLMLLLGAVSPPATGGLSFTPS